MRIFQLSECRMRPPSDVGPQVWLTNALTKHLVFRVLRKDGSVNHQLLNRVTRTVPARKKPKNGVFTVDVTIDTGTKVWCRVFVPAWADPAKKLPIVLYMHGGGFVLFRPDLKEYDAHCRHLAKMCEAIVVSVSYRQAPEFKHPAAYDDGLAALQWVCASGGGGDGGVFPGGADFSRVFLAGDSAGGNIAHHVAVRADALDIPLAGLILIQPLFGGEERTPSELRYRHGKMIELAEVDWYWKAFLPDGADRDHPACNVCGPKAPDCFPLSVPKVLVVVGGRDPLQDRQIRYAEAMQAVGMDCKLVRYDKAFHGFFVFRCVRTTALLHEEIEEFVHPQPDECKSMGGTSTGTATPGSRSFGFLDRIRSW